MNGPNRGIVKAVLEKSTNQKGGERMPAIHYLSELDKVKAYQTYRPIIEDSTKTQLQVLILALINGSDLDYAIDLAMSFPKEA